jgi:farnesyl-diphosphate farnesyltransferase
MIKEIIQSAIYPKEINAMLKLKNSKAEDQFKNLPLEEVAKLSGDKEFCYAALDKVSRSFAVVIRQLPEELKDAVCVFYLILRGLDTIEDDMSFPDEKKFPLLRDFNKICRQSGWKIENVGDSHDYKVLTANFDKVISFYLSLDEKFINVIDDICHRMGNGMADFAVKKVKSIEDYDLYCHYVAGLVGIGLSGLFSASSIESSSLKDKTKISNAMGLFLQKTNIIRDYHEDLHLGRAFWPVDIWSKYYTDFKAFEKNPHAEQSLECLNELVTNAMQHVPDCLEYLCLIRNRKVFRFCAIPQVMAIATLAKVYNNPNVFTGVVKIRKGLAALMMLNTNDVDDVFAYFEKFANEMFKKVPVNAPHSNEMKNILNKIIALTGPGHLPEEFITVKTGKYEMA